MSKRTVLLANTSYLHFDPARFESPFEFRPERFLDHGLYSAEDAVMGDPYKRGHFTLSTARQACSGAFNIALAGFLWAFDIRPPVEEDGVEGEMVAGDEAYPNPAFTIPKAVAARFLPRDEERLDIVKQQWDMASREGYELRGIPVDVDGVTQS